MNDPPNEGPRGVEGLDPLEVVMQYHQETKHSFSRYARSLGYMDWANQPDPFRAQGRGYQSRMNALLRAYMDAHRRNSKRAS